jgi:hypothetical protein
MLRLILQMVRVVRVMENSTQVPNRLIHPVMTTLGQKIQMKPDRKEGSTEVTRNLTVPPGPRIQAESNSKDRALEVTLNLMIPLGQKIQVELGMKQGATMASHSSLATTARTPGLTQETVYTPMILAIPSILELQQMAAKPL